MVGSSCRMPDSSGLAPIRSPAATKIVLGAPARAWRPASPSPPSRPLARRSSCRDRQSGPEPDAVPAGGSRLLEIVDREDLQRNPVRPLRQGERREREQRAQGERGRETKGRVPRASSHAAETGAGSCLALVPASSNRGLATADREMCLVEQRCTWSRAAGRKGIARQRQLHDLIGALFVPRPPKMLDFTSTKNSSMQS